MQSIFEARGGTYHWEGDYRIPNLEPPEDIDIGFWGLRHAEYLRKHQKSVHTELLVTDKLNRYLADIDRQAEDMFFGTYNFSLYSWFAVFPAHGSHGHDPLFAKFTDIHTIDQLTISDSLTEGAFV